MPVLPNEKISIQLVFSDIILSAINDDKIYLTQWHPKLYWDLETHDDYEVRLDVPASYSVATSGALNIEKKYYHANNIKSFGVFISENLKEKEISIKGIKALCLYPPEKEKQAEFILSIVSDVIIFYLDFFGFYPYSNLTIVPGLENPDGGWPIASSLIGLHGIATMNKPANMTWRSRTHWEWIIAHEIGHQYFSEYVIGEDRNHHIGWLMIGLGVYSDREYMRSRGLSGIKHKKLIESYLKGIEKGLDTTIEQPEEAFSKIDYDFNNLVVHGKGFSVISALSCTLGHETFKEILEKCLKDFNAHRLGVYRFRFLCEEQTGADLAWFFDQWTHSNKYLSYVISQIDRTTLGSQYVTKIHIKRVSNLKMPVPIASYFEDGTVQINATNRLLDENIIILNSSAPLVYAKIDPYEELPLIAPIDKEIRLLSNVKSGKQAYDLYSRIKQTGLARNHQFFKLGLMLYDGGYFDESLQVFCWISKWAKYEPSLLFGATV